MPDGAASRDWAAELAVVADRFESGRGLPPACYTDQEFYAAEIERIFRREWLCIGREDEVPKSGDYLSVELLGEPLVMLRGGDDRLRVLSRVCRHRSMPVVEGRGNTKTLLCPYHHWTYGLDGRLAGAPEMGKTPGFDPKAVCLPEVRSEAWEGFVFVNFEADAVPLSPQLQGASKLLANYRLSELRTVRSLPFDIECRWNWKLMCDNFIEPYHHVGVHLKSLEPVLPARQSEIVESDGPWTMVHMRYRKGRSPEEAPDPSAPNLPPFPGADALERRTFTLLHIFPNLLISFFTDHMQFYRLFPEGAERVHMEKIFCYPPESMALPHFEEAVEHNERSFIEFRDEDIDAVLVLQRAYHARHAQPGIFSHLERPIWDFARWVADRMKGF